MHHACFVLLAVLLTSAGRAAPSAQPGISGTRQATTAGDIVPLRSAWVISRDRSGGWQLLGYSPGAPSR
jgi:hypothetical protein